MGQKTTNETTLYLLKKYMDATWSHFTKKVKETGRGDMGHYVFTDLIGMLTWLNTLTVYI